MCLWYNEKIDSETEKRLSKNGKILAWKVLERSSDKTQLQSPYWYTKYKAGWNTSNIQRKETRLAKNQIRGGIHKGIHVYLQREEAETSADCLSDDTRVVPVICHKKDFVAAGWFSSRESAVFRKVWMNKASYDRAMKRRT